MTMLGDSVRRRQPRRPAKRERPAPGGRPVWVRWLPAAIAAVLIPFALGYFIAVRIFFPPPTAVAAGIPVPSLIGMQAGEAERTLTAAGLGGLVVSELPHPQQRPGTIIAQAPLAGQQIRAGEPVSVAVSAGRPRAIVPDVTGFQSDRAELLLTRLGFQTDVRFEESDVPEGRVMRVDPQPGVDRELPAAVVLTVSSGPPPLEFGPDDPPLDTIAPPDTLAPPPAPGGAPGDAPTGTRR